MEYIEGETMFEEFKTRTENGEKITKEELISALQHAKDIDPNKHNGCYEFVKEIVNCYSKLSEQDIEKLDYNDANLIYFTTVWDYSIESRKKLIDLSHFNEDIKSHLHDILSSIWHNTQNGAYESKNIGFVGTGYNSFKNQVSDIDCQKFIKACITLNKSQNEEQAFEIADIAFSEGIKGIQAATGSIIFHCLKPNIFPILNSRGYIFKILDFNLKKPDKLTSYTENCKLINQFRKDNSMAWKNYRVLDLLSINLELTNELTKFKKILEIFVKQLKINGNVLEGDHHTGQGYRGHSIRNLYKEYREFDAFTLDIALQGGTGIGTRVNYIHVTDSWINIIAEYQWLDNNKCDVTGLKISIKSDNNIIKESRVYSLSELGLFDNSAPNDKITEFFEEYKKEFFNYKNAINVNVINNENMQKDNKMSMKRNIPKNLILYGPPGTGKTYNSIIYAVAIVENKNVNEIIQETQDNFSAVKTRYDKYIKESRIAFTTFHQSYGYEEFIEGIKPKTDDNGNVTYSVENGVFKEFCEKTIKNVATKDELRSLGINDDNPTIWKVSLKGTGENQIRKDCLKNGYIRIGFDSYGKDVSDETNFSQEGGKNVLNAFIAVMKKGDIVLSCYSNTSIDAIGVVTGDYEWREDFPDYKRVRKVNWIVKKNIENVDTHNGNKTLTLGTVYKLNDIDRSWVYSFFNNPDNKERKNLESDENPRVFIIDEINRGNISKIFGELITLIEDTKRLGEKEEMKVKLPYSKEEFGVPNNVYILGTMNTADRSISLIDTALRRRFAFKEMMPDLDLLKDINVCGINIKNLLKTMNERIEFLYDREHQIGHSFFMKLNENPTMENLAGIFKDKIIPLLQEYFYDDYEKIWLVLGDNQKINDNNRFIKKDQKEPKDLFGANKENDLDKKDVFKIDYEAFEKMSNYRFLGNEHLTDDTITIDNNAAREDATSTKNE